MTNDTTSPSRFKRLFNWLRKRRAPIGGLLFALAIFIGIGIFYLRDPEFFTNLQNLGSKGSLIGYGAIFAISILLNATIIIPVSNVTIIAAMGAALSLPWLVGVVGGLGGGIGEMSGYIAGRSGRSLIAQNKIYQRLEGWVKKWGWIAVFVLSVIPLAFDVVAIIAGAMRMPVWKFFVATWLGRTVFYIAAAYFGKSLLAVVPFLH